ncbi:MAG: hypothetical protein P1U67_14025 [Alcanivoracaceae bacterium]|nr:hypothetical protein [Alcanivoracaceae bacterium]
MQKPVNAVLTRDQFIKLRNAKSMIKTEFGKDVSLQDEDILNQIYAFALESNGEKLFDLFTEISNDSGTAPSPSNNGKPAAHANNNISHAGRVMVGDVIEGRVVTGMYRGKPLFKD